MRTIYKTDNGVLSQKEMFEPDVDRKSTRLNSSH